MAEKPPLGVPPQWICQERRLAELCEAVARYQRAAQALPKEWLEELRDLAAALLDRARHEPSEGVKTK